ncbi:hypothetical protein SAY86_000460 [Trapa natans]|uniref:Uncharacterized protein n=1 Tax=Trapa natans TaxID=22666 RepID=A0AAN7MC28_TRANT|nr:hypothetical protein SAY86_000460 [Trapa natans]
MTGNEEGKQQVEKVVSDSVQAGPNAQYAFEVPPGDVTCDSQHVETSTAGNDMANETGEFNSSGVTKLLEEKDQLDSGGLHIEGVGCIANESLHHPSEDVSQNSPSKDTMILPEIVGERNATDVSPCHIYAELNNDIGCSSEDLRNDSTKKSYENGLVEVEVIQNPVEPIISQEPNLADSAEPVLEGLEICVEDRTNCELTEHFEIPVEVVYNLDHLETSPLKAVENFDMAGHINKWNTRRSKKDYMLRSSGNKRSRQSMASEISEILESINQTGNTTANEESNHTRRKEKRTMKVISDEYLRIKRNLSYMLNRIHYERSLIDAYSSEGWKGLSLEKLKPEKELQRATSEIVNRKLKIRDLFQRLESMCSEGRQLSEDLFDDEGMIDSEDIFCAKCGSKDLSLDNDIILCDGACERGFHQFCLEPPLLKEDIPPGDEGWLCPGCDCKVDCLDMLNESQGTNLSIKDRWQKVFPEAVKAVNQDPASGLSSDDSEDEDFDPDRPRAHGSLERNESSSDGSEYATASDNSEPRRIDSQYLGLPSDDSEDDDFDPNAPNPDTAKAESSSSDFTSDSEDLESALVNDDPHGSKGISKSASLRGRKGPKRKSFKGGGKKQVMNYNLKLSRESEHRESGATPVSARRIVGRLDYKRLHDEAYGGTSSDSSDDEDWTDTPSPKRRKCGDGDERQLTEENGAGLTKPQSRRKSGGTCTPAKAKPTDAKNQTSGSRRLGEDVKKRLCEVFASHLYPDRATRESLSAELGITLAQVSKWFGHARWSLNHPPVKRANAPSKKVKKEASNSPQANTKSSEKMLPSGVSGIREMSVPIPNSSQRDDKRGNALLEQSEEADNRQRSAPGKKC